MSDDKELVPVGEFVGFSEPEPERPAEEERPQTTGHDKKGSLYVPKRRPGDKRSLVDMVADAATDPSGKDEETYNQGLRAATLLDIPIANSLGYDNHNYERAAEYQILPPDKKKDD